MTFKAGDKVKPKERDLDPTLDSSKIYVVHDVGKAGTWLSLRRIPIVFPSDWFILAPSYKNLPKADL